MPTTKNLLDLTVGHATRYLETVDTRPIATTSTIDALRERLGRPLPEAPMASDRVINELVRDTAGGILGSTNPRFFGWVIGGTLPVALAADWLTSTWDQNAASNLTAPAEAVVEDRQLGEATPWYPSERIVRLRHRLSDGPHDGHCGCPIQTSKRPSVECRGIGPRGWSATPDSNDRKPA